LNEPTGLHRRSRYSYGGHIADGGGRAAKPSDLPIQQPTKFEFVIDLKTAKAFGIVIPLLCSWLPTR
jgi:putative ABC transport system substrate-binding protein